MPRKRLVQFLGGLGLATAPGYPTPISEYFNMIKEA